MPRFLSRAASVDLPRVINAEEVSELAIVVGVVNHEIRSLAPFK